MEEVQSGEHLQIPPRLRLSRYPYPSSFHGYDGETHVEDEEDNSSTPRRAPLDVSAEQTPVATSSNIAPLEGETPAARLRALMARASTSTSATPKPAQPSPPSVYDSDLDEHNDINRVEEANRAPSASTHDSLRNLFTKALREPGDTPVKPRRRRSSIGSNAADESPVKLRSKVARKSFSDDEVERSFGRNDETVSEKSFKSTHAAVFDSLRARLSESSFNTSSIREPLSEISLPNNHSSPPAATSTPMRQSMSIFPVQLSASNLMNDDSNMRRAMKALDSDTSGDVHLLGELSKSSAGKTPRGHTPSAEPKSSRNRERTLSRLGSNDSFGQSSSRPVSRQDISKTTDPVHEKERGWNRPLSAYMDRHKFGSTDSLSPGHSRPNGLRKQGSAASLRSLEDNSIGRSSPSHSIGGHSNHSSHEKEAGAGNGEIFRETQGSSYNRSSSTSPVHIRVSGRSRTLSQPSKTNLPAGRQRVDSLTSSTPRERPASSLSHNRSTSSLHHYHDRTPSRASSPASSAEHDSVTELQHLRERNWNSPHPNWSIHNGRHSLTQAHSYSSPSGGKDSSRPRSVNGYNRRDSSPSSSVSGSERNEEVSAPKADSLRNKSISLEERSRSKSFSGHSSTTARPRASFRDRPHSPSISANHVGNPRSTTPVTSPPATSRLTNGSSRANGIPATSRSSSSAKPSHDATAGFISHIPVRPKSKNERPPSPTTDSEKGERPVSQGGGIQKTSVATASVMLHDSDFESSCGGDAASVSSDKSKDSDVESPATNTQGNDYSDVDEIPAEPETPIGGQAPDSPTITTRANPPSTPKRSMYGTSKLEYKSPTIPVDLPDLPEPPSEDEDSDSTPRTPFKAQLERYSVAKTPRPPGAWSTPYQTPASARTEVVPKDDSAGFEVHNELFTPPASLSRATSIPLRTPAPPGAWMPTPALDKKKAQRVRFGESSTAASSENRVYPDEEEKPKASQSLDQTSPFEQDTSSAIPAVSTNGSTRSPRRTSGIRVMDAFGKEISGQEGSESFDVSVNPFASDGLERSPTSKRKGTRIRVVDAVGVDKEERNSRNKSQDEEISAMVKGIEERNMNNQQARDLIAKTIADLKSDVDRYPMGVDAPDTTNSRMVELNQQIHLGSEKRRQLQDALANAQQMAIPVTVSKAKVSPKGHRLWVPSKLLATFLAIQILIVLVLCRVVTTASRNAFLTTYIDPFNPELYLHITNPEIFRTLADTPEHVARRMDLTRYAFRTLHNFVDLFLSVQDVWYPWSTSSRSVAWPPT